MKEIYKDGTLTCTSYFLEAIQPHDRDSAIAAAMQNREVMEKRNSTVISRFLIMVTFIGFLTAFTGLIVIKIFRM